MDSDVLLRNLKLTADSGVDLLIRIPMINGYNADRQDMEEFARILSILGNTTLRVELLRYHEYGKVKWEKLGRTYEVENGAITDAQYRMFKEIIQQHGLKIVTT